jgi:hypothetical protein
MIEAKSMIIVSDVWTDLSKGYQRILELQAKLPVNQRARVDIISQWKHRLSSSASRYDSPSRSPKPTSMSLREDIPTHKAGDGGENKLIASLSDVLDDRFFAIQGLLVAHRLDIDVLVVGPTGIWVLESKDWSGTITVRGGDWYRQKWGGPDPSEYNRKGNDLELPHYHSRLSEFSPTWGNNGSPQNPSKYSNRNQSMDKKRLPQNQQRIKAFDRQWLREKEEVERVIRTLRLSPENANHPRSLVRGGLVFTHPRVKLEFDRSCKAGYGDIHTWVSKVKHGKFLQELKEKNIISILDSLLRRSFALKKLQESDLSSSIAEEIYREALANP